MGSVALSGPARRLWGKSDRAENAYWLPLYVHLSDAGHVAGYLWDQWVPEGTRSVIAKEFGDPDGEQAQKRARQLLVFLASVHDIGKATPVFQSQPTTHVGEHRDESLSDDAYLRLFRPESEGGAGFLCSQGLQPNHPPHAVAGQILLEKYLEQAGFPAGDEISGRQARGNKALRRQIRESLVCIVGGHHGCEPLWKNVNAVKTDPYTLDAIAETRSEQQDSRTMTLRDRRDIDASIDAPDYCAPWRQARQELIGWAMETSGFDFSRPWSYPLSVQSQILLTGLVIMADWIASDQDIFPLVPLEKSGTAVRQQAGLLPDNRGLGSVDGRGTGCPNSVQELDVLDLTTDEGLKRRAECAWKALGFESPWKDPEQHQTAEELFGKRFDLPEGAHLRPVQKAAVEAVLQAKDPRLLVIEAPMGEGKTEAALAAAEVLARRAGRGGVCVALPTRATTDAMFSRVVSWLHHLPAVEDQDGNLSKTVYLAHQNASLNQQFARIAGFSHRIHEQIRENPEISSIAEDEENERRANGQGAAHRWGGQSRKNLSQQVVASDWMWGRKKGVLSNFVVCTVDQVLMASLQMKHSVLRDLALANKVVVIDECHACDSYMRCYLGRALEWLGSCGAPVVLLSATLPAGMRDAYICAYRTGYCAYQAIGLTQGQARSVYQPKDYEIPDEPTARDGYPLITLLDGDTVRYRATQPAGSRTVRVRASLMGDSQQELLAQVSSLVGNGGCLGVICDTVRRAQEAYDTLKNSGRFAADEIRLVHARFINVDRMQKGNELRVLLGPDAAVVGTHGRKPIRPKRLIVVGTQVLEQSLDIDFDALITDIAPVDLLFQRLGRVHRHHRGEGESERPENLRVPICKIRGIGDWDDGLPLFEPPKAGRDAARHQFAFSGIAWDTKEAKGVYPSASLYEALAVVGLTVPDAVVELHLPTDIAPDVRCAYSQKHKEAIIPQRWQGDYELAAQARKDHDAQEERKAQGFLAASYADLSRRLQTVMKGNRRDVNTTDEDEMIRAVRDTPEQLTVLVLRAGIEDGEKVIRLLPWLGGGHDGLPGVRGGEDGMHVPTGPAVEGGEDLPDDLAQLVVQCAVTLPRNWRVPVADLTAAFERADGQIIFGWQQNRFLAGQLPLFVNADGRGSLRVERQDGKSVDLEFSYTRERGLEMTTVGTETPVMG